MAQILCKVAQNPCHYGMPVNKALEVQDMDAQIINGALSHYKDWSTPWEYISDVHSYPGLDEVSIKEIEEIWSAANSEEIWVYPSNKSETELAQAKLKSLYPWLNDKAIENLIRGALYNWK